MYYVLGLCSGRGLAVGRKAVLPASVCRRWSLVEEGEVVFSLRVAEYMWGKSLLSYRMKQMERVRRDSETAVGCNGQSLLYDPF